MRINIFLLIVIIQQAVCVHQTIFDLSRHRLPQNHDDDFDKPMEYQLALSDDYYFQSVDKPSKESVYAPGTTRPLMKQNSHYKIVQYQDVPRTVGHSTRRKRPSSSNMEKLTYLLKNYNPARNIDREIGNKKRTHLFGFWTNYLARN